MSLHNTDAQEVGVHVIAPAAALEADPLQHAVAAFPLSKAAAAVRAGGVRLPEGAGRFAVSVDGTEPEEDVAALRVWFLLTPYFYFCYFPQVGHLQYSGQLGFRVRVWEIHQVGGKNRKNNEERNWVYCWPFLAASPCLWTAPSPRKMSLHSGCVSFPSVSAAPFFLWPVELCS